MGLFVSVSLGMSNFDTWKGKESVLQFELTRDFILFYGSPVNNNFIWKSYFANLLIITR